MFPQTEYLLATRRMFEMAKDAIVEKAKYEIIGGYYSPVYVSTPLNPP